jgi:ribosomal protein S12 methylthiotransferase
MPADTAPVMSRGSTYWLETLGCPKNQVDSDKLAGLLEAQGYQPARRPDQADLLVVNTCAFIEAAREESIGTVLDMAGVKKDGAQLTITGCMAQRYGAELAAALPEVDLVAGFGVPVQLARRPPERRGARPEDKGDALPTFDLLNLPRPPTSAPWAYVKVAEGCDRHCGFCAIPSFRGPQRSRSKTDILAEVEALDVAEVVLVAQDLVSWDRDQTAPGALVEGGARTGKSARREKRPDRDSGDGPDGLVGLVQAVGERVDRVRLLYLYPSGLSNELVQVIGNGGCPYFDLSLQHVSRPLLRRMRRFGDGDRFIEKIEAIRDQFPQAALRSSFIIGYPGETEEDQDALLEFLAEARLDWVGFFSFSTEEGTHAAGLPDQVPSSLALERLRECSELQDGITAAKRANLVGTSCRALVDVPGQARSHREAPEIDGVVRVPTHLRAGSWVQLEITDSIGPDLVGLPVST